jgi:hypothetical protein
MADEQLIEEGLSDSGKVCVAHIQELYSAFDLDEVDGMLVGGEIMGWATLVSMGRFTREETMEQLERNLAAVREWVNQNYEPFKARREMLERLEAGDSGGRLQ